MKKKLYAGLLVVLSVMMFFTTSVLAVTPGEKRVAIGADLSETQITDIYEDFGVTRGDVPEIKVTNAEERTYLNGLVPDSMIGTRSISCIYLNTLEEGAGISVSINNINWCTEGMYANALLTAGVTDAEVKVSAPFPVSGTAALTGAYKAYEDITGESLDQTAKEAGAEELVVTGELAEVIGSEQATALINELKKILDQTKNMSDEELREIILKIAAEQNVTLSEENITQLISLVRTLEKLDIDDWAQKLAQLKKTTEEVGGFFAGIGKFFEDVGAFFSNLFESIGNWFK